MDFFIGILMKLLYFLNSLTALEAYLFIFTLLLICGFGLPMPEDITIIAAGITASLGKISVAGALIICFLGVMVGDSIIFFLGRHFKDRVFNFPLIRKIKKAKIKKAKKNVQSNSKLICFVARFLPGLRALTFMTAGVLKVSPVTFFCLDGFAALISIPVWVYLGWLFGNNIPQVLIYAKQFNYFIFGFLALFILGYIIFKYTERKKLMSDSVA